MYAALENFVYLADKSLDKAQVHIHRKISQMLDAAEQTITLIGHEILGQRTLETCTALYMHVSLSLPDLCL